MSDHRGEIVIIDDAELVVRVLRKALEGQGWNVRSANSGAAGVAEVRRQRPDVVISDLHMPDMNGHQVIEALHRSDRQLPIILLSSDAELSAVLGAVRRGAFDYVLKSDLGNLSAAVERAHAYSKQASGGPSGDLEPALDALRLRLVELENAALRSQDGDMLRRFDAVKTAAAAVASAGGQTWD